MFSGRFRIERALASFIKIKETLLKAVEECREEKRKKQEEIDEANIDIKCIDVSISRAEKAVKGLEQII